MLSIKKTQVESYWIGSRPPSLELVDQKGIDCIIPKYLENPLMLEIYDSTIDTNKHIKHVDIDLDYHQVRDVVKCKLFSLTLKWATMT